MRDNVLLAFAGACLAAQAVQNVDEPGPTSAGEWEGALVAFRIFFGIDVIIALVVLYFFADGCADGTVSSFNIGIWLALLVGAAVPLAGGWLLRAVGRLVGATILLGVLAIPGVLVGFFFLLMIALPGSYR